MEARRYSRIHNYTCSMARNVESVTFDGVVYRRYPESKRWSDRSYFRASAGAGKESLHRELYKSHHGPIPDGWHVHHVDGDPGNNDPGNLAALPADEHHAHHNHDRPPPPPPSAEALAKAAEWHRSSEGRAWHRTHAQEAWAKREPLDAICEWCGDGFEDISRRAKFCSNKCKTAARFASGVDDVDRECATCGTPFRINRYRKTKTCSRACAGRLRGRTKTGLQPDDGD